MQVKNFVKYNKDVIPEVGSIKEIGRESSKKKQERSKGKVFLQDT